MCPNIQRFLLGETTYPICLPKAPNSDPDHLMERNGVLVGYGPEHEDSDGLTLLTHKIEPKWTCDGIYNPDNVAIGQARQKVISTLPEKFHESLICGSDTTSSTFGSCPGDSGAPLLKISRNRQTFVFCHPKYL